MGRHHGIPIPISMSLSPTSNDNNLGLQQHPLFAGGASGFHFQLAPFAAGSYQQAGGLSAFRKVRGRPPGSKNKPKGPMCIPQENNDFSVKATVIEICGGKDVMEATVQVARRSNAGIAVLGAAGVINSVTICHPLNQSAPYTLYGPFALLGLSGSYLTPSTHGAGFPSALPPFIPNLPPSAIHSAFGISLAGVQGNVFGGIVAGKVMAAAQGVTVTALLFKNPEYHRIGVFEGEIVEKDIDDDEEEGGGASGSAIVVSGPAPAPDPAPMGYGGASGSGSGAGASGSAMPAFGPAQAPAPMGFGGIFSSRSGAGASGSSMPVFGPAATQAPMDFGGAFGSGRDAGASSSGIPVFSPAPMGYEASDLNAMHWGQGLPVVQSPSY